MENQDTNKQLDDEQVAPDSNAIPEVDHNETDQPSTDAPAVTAGDESDAEQPAGAAPAIHPTDDTIVQNGVVESAEVQAPYTGGPEVEPSEVIAPDTAVDADVGHNVTGAPLVEPGQGNNDSDLDVPAGSEVPPSDIPEGAFGDMVTVEGTATDMAVRLLCWHLTTSGALGNQSMVYIHDDAEAMDIAQKWGINLAQREDGVYVCGMTFPHIDVLLKDKSPRILLCRVINFCATHADPPVEKILASISAAVQDQQAKKQQAAQ